MPDLKPCPNPECQNKGVYVGIGGVKYGVDCPKCRMSGPEFYSHAEAVDAWNALPRKEDLARMTALAKRLYALLEELYIMNAIGTLHVRDDKKYIVIAEAATLLDETRPIVARIERDERASGLGGE